MQNTDIVSQLTNLVIRPHREIYGIDKLGPKKILVKSNINNNKQFIHAYRKDITLETKNQTKIQVSIFQPENQNIQQSTPNINQSKLKSSQQLSNNNFQNYHYQNSNKFVIFLHSNSGSRIQGLQYAKYILQYNINVAIFDYSGSGISEGQYVTMGINQSKDLHQLINYIQSHYKNCQISLWGRSMGAVTAIIYSSKFPENISGMVLDSPFSSFSRLINDLAKSKTGLPNFLFSPIISRIQKSIQQKTHCDLFSINLKQNMTKLKSVSCLFLTSKSDQLVPSSHTMELYESHDGKKDVLYLQGHHNEPRSLSAKQKCAQFLSNTLHQKIKQKQNDKNKNILQKEEHKVKASIKKHIQKQQGFNYKRMTSLDDKSDSNYDKKSINDRQGNSYKDFDEKNKQFQINVSSNTNINNKDEIKKISRKSQKGQDQVIKINTNIRNTVTHRKQLQMTPIRHNANLNINKEGITHTVQIVVSNHYLKDDKNNNNHLNNKSTKNNGVHHNNNNNINVNVNKTQQNNKNSIKNVNKNTKIILTNTLMNQIQDRQKMGKHSFINKVSSFDSSLISKSLKDGRSLNLINKNNNINNDNNNYQNNVLLQSYQSFKSNQIKNAIHSQSSEQCNSYTQSNKSNNNNNFLNRNQNLQTKSNNKFSLSQFKKSTFFSNINNNNINSVNKNTNINTNIYQNTINSLNHEHSHNNQQKTISNFNLNMNIPMISSQQYLQNNTQQSNQSNKKLIHMHKSNIHHNYNNNNQQQYHEQNNKGFFFNGIIKNNSNSKIQNVPIKKSYIYNKNKNNINNIHNINNLCGQVPNENQDQITLDQFLKKNK